MSIPPLVCSTPPPPEQCDDEKDQEDFDLNYRLSQEDDEGNNYGYGDYSSFNHFQSLTPKTCLDFNATEKESGNVKCDNNIGSDIEICDINTNEKIPRVTLEDDVLEDLNLIIDHEPAINISTVCQEETIDIINDKKTENALIDSHTDIPADVVDVTVDQHVFKSNDEDSKIVNSKNTEENIPLHLNESSPILTDEILIEKSDHNDDDNISNVNINEEIVCTNLNNNFEESLDTLSLQNVDDNVVQKTVETNDIDEFEDFDDFQFVSSTDKQTEITNPLDISENPWQNDASKDDGFGDFTAHFGEDVNDDTQTEILPVITDKQHDSEDDFGDFDEFQSVDSTKLSNTPADTCDEVPVLNLQSADSEHQIIEQINNVMQTIFKEEITEPNEIFESKLEGSLGETWCHLRETDVRQPYIVNWNNSLSQKTLLKALCIDSRNILFGPKWSSNMPKYAATLSNAPLQPQKQVGQSNVLQNEVVNSEKTINKTWTDPFTTDGQEFTYAEALLLDLEHLMATLDQMAHNHSTLKISELLSHACHTERENTAVAPGPTDLDVFEAAVSAKPDKIYSSTLSIQPMRQINLPDTHIFTPTNSEIPRSKTIHYDNTSPPTVILPQPVPESNTSSQTCSENDSDYWEFQDFRGTSDNKVLESTVNFDTKDQNKENNVNKDEALRSNLTMATQVLQPIKLEPIIPTLNWPNPGEVKETFEDFSDFMSNTAISNDKQDLAKQDIVNSIPPTSVSEKDVGNKYSSENTFDTADKVDDDFDMFQCAMPPIKNTSQGESSITDRDQPSSSQVASVMPDFDVVFPKVEKVKSENISLNTKPNENLLKSLDVSNTFKIQSIPSTTLQMNTNVLQPTPAASNIVKQNPQKMGQILQPLSLEGYSQINWPNPGIDLQDLSRFNPVESLQSLKTDSNSHSKTASPVHNHKGFTNSSQASDEDIWGEFVSSKPKQQQVLTKKQTTFADDDEWTDFVSSPTVNPQNGLNTISLNVHTNSSLQKSSNSTKYPVKTNDMSLDIPALNYITPKNNKSYNDRHFQNL